MRRKCKRAPCNRLQKAYEENVLIPFPGPVKDRPKPPRTRWSKCFEERKIHRELVAKEAVYSLRDSIATHQRYNALGRHIDVRPFPRIEDEDLIDLDDLPSKAKTKKNAIASDWYQRKMEFLPYVTKTGIAAKLKKLKDEQITTDFDVVSHMKRCQQSKLREKISNIIQKRGLNESKAICARREVAALRRKIMGERSHYRGLCQRMEEKDRKLSALVVANRGLLTKTDRKIQLLFHFQQDFQEDRADMMATLRDLQKRLKKMDKQEFPPKYTQGYPPKPNQCSKKKGICRPCNRGHDSTPKGPQTEFIIMNHTQLPESRCPKLPTAETDTPTTSEAPTTSETKVNQFWHLKECAKLRNYKQDLKISLIRSQGAYDAFVKHKKERIEDFSADAEAEYFTPIRRAVRQKIKKRLKYWRRRAIIMRQLKPEATYCRRVLKKHTRHIAFAYRYAMGSLQRIAIMALSATERGMIAERLATAQDIAQRGPVRNKPEILPLLLLHMDEILMRQLRAMKVRPRRLL